MAEFKGGRGKKVSYETQMYRIPTPLKPTLERLGLQFRLLWDGLTDPRCEKLVSRVEAAILDPEQLETSNQENLISGITDKNNLISSLAKEIEALKEENSKLQWRLDDMAAKAGEWYEKAKMATEEIERIKSQQTRTTISPEAIALLQNAIAPKSKGGSYTANNASGMRQLVEQALALLVTDQAIPRV